MADKELYERELLEETIDDTESVQDEITAEKEAKLLQEDKNEIDTKAQVKETGQETEQNKNKHSKPDNLLAGSSNTFSLSQQRRQEVDMRSVYVANVDYGASAEELESHFGDCGTINRVTILCNETDGHPKGFAYIEFAYQDGADTALGMHETFFRGRSLKVMPKRTNRPGLSSPKTFQNRTSVYREPHFANHRGSPSGFRSRRIVYRGRENYYHPY